MGLGLRYRATWKKRWTSFLNRSNDGHFKAFSDAASRFGQSSGLDRFTSLTVSSEGGQAWLALHPTAEPVDLLVEGDDIILSAQTSACGPGYHAYVVAFMKFAASELKLDWRKNGDEGDETDYFEDQDFGALQRHMLEWLQASARMMLSNKAKGYEFFMLSLPVWVSQQLQSGGGEVAMPLGYKDARFFKRCLEAKGEELDGCGAEWFVWWEQVPGTQFWLKTGLNLMWVDVPWRTPFEDSDKKIYADVEFAIANALRLDPTAKVPEGDLAEMRRLSSASGWMKPNNTGIGYRRGLLRRPFPGGWTAVVPGYWREQHDIGNSTYWYEEMTAEGSSLSVTNPTGREFQIDELLTPSNNEVERARRDDDAYAIEQKTYDDQGLQQPWIFGRIAKRQQLFILSIFLTDPSQIEYAKEIIRSARYDGPGDP
jgi:hypothetical protein